MKIVTICGSYKYKSEMISVYQQLTDLGYIVLFPAMGCKTHNKKWYLELHTKKIAMSDAIFVVDVNHYFGESTIYEISKAEEFGKEIIFYSNNKLGVA